MNWTGTWLVVGLARSGCAAGGLLKRRGAHVIGGDDALREALDKSWSERGLTEPAAAAFDEVRCGAQWFDTLPELAGIVVSPGVPCDHPALVALAGRVPVIGELELGWRACAARTIAITGTNGKTTTTELTAHVLRAAGLDARALGNVGRPFCDVADTLAPTAVAVIECSSFQLETIDDFSPEAGAVLNLAPDHLDRYPNLAAYYDAKQRLVTALGNTGVFVTWNECEEALSWPANRRTLFGERQDSASVFLKDGIIGRVRGGDFEPILPANELTLVGRPNLWNALAAIALVETFDLSVEVLAKGLRSFRGLEHRQQLVAESHGIRFVNDSKATNVHAVCAGLAGYHEGVVLILGGSGKGEDYGPLRDALAAVTSVLLMGDEAVAFESALSDVTTCHRVSSLEEAVTLGAELAHPSGTVLLSPACASFDMFRDYHHRGHVFRDAALAWCQSKDKA